MQDTRKWCFVAPHQQNQNTSGSTYLLGGTYEEQRYCHKFIRGFATLIQTLDCCFGDHANERADYGICDGIFGAQNIQEDGEWTPRWWCHNSVAPRQIKQSIFMLRYQDALLIWQTEPHWVFLLQSKEQ